MAGADNKSGREPSGRDPESIRQRLDKLGQQLAEAKGKRAAAPQSEPEARGAALDRLFGSAPFLMVVFLILGSAAGILNVVRTAKAMQTEVSPGNAPPAVLDDDDD
jgi:ATP synthase protein I